MWNEDGADSKHVNYNIGLLCGPKRGPKFLDCELNFYFQLGIAVLIDTYSSFFNLCPADLDPEKFSTFVACELNNKVTNHSALVYEHLGI